jgi:predicted transcriptional regulator
MSKIGKRVAKWVDSQTEIAEEIGVSPSAISKVVTGKARLRLARFVQIVYALNPPQEEIDEIFNLYLDDLGIPHHAMKLLHSDSEHSGDMDLSLSQTESRITKIINLVMASDIDDSAKVKVYNIIQETGKK